MNSAAVYAWLAASAPVTALLGSPPRLYPLTAPDSITGTDGGSSYATYQGVTGRPENTFAGSAGADFVRVQIDAYARSYVDAQALATTIAEALDARGYVVSWNGETWDQDVRRFRVSFDFEFFATR